MKVTLAAYCFDVRHSREVAVEVSDVVEERFHRVRKAMGATIRMMLERVALTVPCGQEPQEHHVVAVLNLIEARVAIPQFIAEEGRRWRDQLSATK